MLLNVCIIYEKSIEVLFNYSKKFFDPTAESHKMDQ